MIEWPAVVFVLGAVFNAGISYHALNVAARDRLDDRAKAADLEKRLAAIERQASAARIEHAGYEHRLDALERKVWNGGSR